MKTEDFVVNNYSSENSLEEYGRITKSGLWKEEKFLFNRYFKNGKILLDLGCGTGRAAYNIEQKLEIYACDLVPAMIYEARELEKYFNNRPKFSVQDARSLDYSDSKFDYVLFAYNGINTVPGKENRKKIIKEVERVLKPGGVFIFATHTRNIMKKPLLWLKRYVQVITKSSEHIREFGDNIHYKYGRGQYINIPSLKELKTLISSSNFKILEIVNTDSISSEPNITMPPRNTKIFICRKQ